MEANSKAAKIPPSLLVKALPVIRQKIEAFFIWALLYDKLAKFQNTKLYILNFLMAYECLLENIEDACKTKNMLQDKCLI